jgi:hypothetical protein
MLFDLSLIVCRNHFDLMSKKPAKQQAKQGKQDGSFVLCYAENH